MLHHNHVKSSNGTHASPAPAENHVPPARRRILVVDDNEMTCKQLQKILQADASLQVEYQTDGNQALERCPKTITASSSPTCPCRNWTAWI